MRTQAQVHLTAVARAAKALQVTALFQTVGQPDGAVMVDQQAFRDLPDGWRILFGRGLNGKQELMLLGFEALGLSSLLAESQKSANLVPEVGQRPVITSSHINIVSRYNVPDQRRLEVVVRLRSIANFTSPTRSCTLSLRMRLAR